MPNSRRRKFSVKFDLESRPSRLQSQNASQNSNLPVDTKIATSKTEPKLTSENQTVQNIAKPPQRQITSKISNTTIVNTKRLVTTADKDVTASLSPNNMSDSTENQKSPTILCDKTFSTCNEERKILAESSKPKTVMGRERHARQHKIKIRNPRRRIVLCDNYNKLVIERSIGSNTDNPKSTFDTAHTDSAADAYGNIETASDNSLDDMCRICHGDDTFSQELGDLISACSCRGTVGRVHVKCLERWLTESGKSRCELCGIRYITRRVHRYGVPRALVMWVLSQNAKQLMVDILGIILMSPLAVLAAWLSGRTFASLISQENHSMPAPWPLASTFVLACMTLVCYYCWIVSAATRHTLSWWIWYRSQYEVRLQLHSDNED